MAKNELFNRIIEWSKNIKSETTDYKKYNYISLIHEKNLHPLRGWHVDNQLGIRFDAIIERKKSILITMRTFNGKLICNIKIWSLKHINPEDIEHYKNIWLFFVGDLKQYLINVFDEKYYTKDYYDEVDTIYKGFYHWAIFFSIILLICCVFVTELYQRIILIPTILFYSIECYKIKKVMEGLKR
ncbi:MAG: hypothetical protein ACFFB5_24795 [Promethearchaeota archaeon]